jgi:glycosidase
LDFNGARLTLAYVLMFLLPRSTPTLYYGEEAGLGNDEEYARAEARKRAQALASLGAGEWADSYDARDVHRQRVGLEDLLEAAAKPHPVASAFRRLSALRSEFPAMGACARVERVSSPYESVILMKRCAQSGSAVFGAINLSAKELEVGLGGLTLKKEALFESGGPFVRTISGGLSLAPESCLLTEIERPT